MRYDLEELSFRDTGIDNNEAIKGILFRLKSFRNICRALVYKLEMDFPVGTSVYHSGSDTLKEVVVTALWDNWEDILTQ